MYSVEFLDDARRDIGRLDKSVVLRIRRKIEWLAQNIESVQTIWLRGDLAGLAKIREGDFRIIYETRDVDKVILIHFIGHRSEVYKRG